MFLSQRGGAGAKGERVVWGEVIAASKVKTNWWKLSKTTDLSLFVCLELWNPTKQLLFVCLELSKPPTNFCLFVKSSQTRPVEFCSDSTILKQSEQNSFFVLRPASWLEVATYFVPHIAYPRRSDFSVEEWFCPFFYFSITPPFDLHCAPQCKRHWILWIW